MLVLAQVKAWFSYAMVEIDRIIAVVWRRSTQGLSSALGRLF